MAGYSTINSVISKKFYTISVNNYLYIFSPVLCFCYCHTCIENLKDQYLLYPASFPGKIGVCCYIKRAEESVRYTHSVFFILHWISINYGMPYIGFRFKIGACCYTCVKRYQTSIRNRSMLLQS